jgi:hypothetical protein
LVPGNERPETALLALRAPGETEAHRWLCDASLSPEIAAALHDLSFSERKLSGRMLSLVGKRSAAAALPVPQPIRPLGAEQSNISFVFG